VKHVFRPITGLVLFSFIILDILSVSVAFGQSDFKFQGTPVKPGTMQHFTVPVKAGDNATFIPITVFNGAKAGPVLGVTAGVHGYEYPPIMAAQQLITTIDPRELKGTVILVQVSNLEGFLKRSPYVNPIDDINLNRAFPGKKNGSITEKIAHFITTEVIGRSDFFVDLHGGDAPEDLMPYAAYYSHTKRPEISEKGKQMALALGFDHLIVFATDDKKYMKDDENSLYCSAEAFKHRIPSVDIECGRLGKADAHLAEKITAGMINMLKLLTMIDGTPLSNENYITVTQRSWIDAEFTGIFYSEKVAGEYVAKGMEIGTITDFFGKAVGRVRANRDGIILYMLGTPPVNKEDTVVCIGEVN
jgi:predicted deacylase